MRIALYLPAVTPWWFDNIIAKLIRKLAAAAEVHVLVPPFWKHTGVQVEQLEACLDLETVAWHILDWEDHPRLRTSAVGCAELLDLLHDIDPDYVLCRSADAEGAGLFPGKTLFIMEAGFPPFPSSDEWIVLREHPLDHGLMPELSRADRETLRGGFYAAWQRRRSEFPALARAAELERLGLPADRPVVVVPLEYEHEENYFGLHRTVASNADLVAELAERIEDDVFLAVTNHPLNERFCDNRSLHDVLDRLPDRAKLIRGTSRRTRPTFDCTLACDGVILENSKVISVAAFFGTPIMRMSPHRTAAWLNAELDVEAFAGAVRSGAARAPAEEDARAWFAFHVANSVIDLSQPDVDGRLLLDMIERPVDPARWQAGLRRYADAQPEMFQ